MANEKRLIDLDKLIAYFVEQYNIAVEDPDPVSGYVMAALRGCIAYFKTIPTVDAVEVVHGKWEIRDDGYGCELMCCSVCKAEFYDGDNDTVDHPHNYCPNCGAKMDADALEE